MAAFDLLAAARFGADPELLPWLKPQRDGARADWLGGKLPTRKTEAWKYTGLEALAENDYLHAPALPALAVDVLSGLIPDLTADRMVFVNGHCSLRLSRFSAQPGVDIVRFSSADETQRGLIAAHADSIATHATNPFTALSTCWFHDGVLLHVHAGARMTRPLCVVHINTPDKNAFAYAQRLLVVLDAQAEAEVIEHFVSTDGPQNSFVTGVSELYLGQGARLKHVRLHLEDEHSIHIGGVYVSLQADANYDGFLLGLGSRLKRVDVRVQHQGAGSECRMNGVYLAKRSQHIDFHTCIEHEMPRGSTSQVYRGIIDDEARAVFNGRIHIHPQAQKCTADLGNRNLLLSNTAEIDTKPELEIYADDVRCSHGATISQIDEKTLYYLQARGIDRQEARVLLGFGFINELIDTLPREEWVLWLRAVVRDWFDGAARLSRHLS